MDIGKSTQFKSGEKAAESGKKGGIKSGEAKRRKADLRKMAQAILDGTYTDKNGVEVSGEQLVINTLIANLANPNGKNWGKAVDVLMELTGAKRSQEEKAKLKAETEMIKAKAAQLKGPADSDIRNDGFLEALNGTAAADWSDDEDTDVTV